MNHARIAFHYVGILFGAAAIYVLIAKSLDAKAEGLLEFFVTLLGLGYLIYLVLSRVDKVRDEYKYLGRSIDRANEDGVATRNSL